MLVQTTLLYCFFFCFMSISRMLSGYFFLLSPFVNPKSDFGSSLSLCFLSRNPIPAIIAVCPFPPNLIWPFVRLYREYLDPFHSLYRAHPRQYSNLYWTFIVPSSDFCVHFILHFLHYLHFQFFVMTILTILTISFFA